MAFIEDRDALTDQITDWNLRPPEPVDRDASMDKLRHGPRVTGKFNTTVGVIGSAGATARIVVSDVAR